MALMRDVLLAYIDPGSGSLFIQVIIATILAAPFILRTHLSRLYRAIRRRGPAPPDDGDRGRRD